MKKLLTMRNLKTLLLIVLSAVIVKQQMIMKKNFNQTDQIWSALVMCVTALQFERSLQ